MNKYDGKDDDFINAAITNIVAPTFFEDARVAKAEFDRHQSTGTGSRSSVFRIVSPDYCNNPSYMWPIIVSNNISITHYPSGDAMTFIQGGGFSKFKHESKNALRSAAITFLMMKDMTE